MLRFLFQKLTHKKWMVFSLLIGNILLIAVAVSIPMYKNASLQRMLTDEFRQYLEINNTNPNVINMKGTIEKGYGLKTFISGREYIDDICHDLGVEKAGEAYKTEHIYLPASKATPDFEREQEDEIRNLQVNMLNELEKHVKMVSGEMYKEGFDQDGYAEAIVSSSTFTEKKLMLGDTFTFNSLKREDGTPFKIRIVGVFENDENADGYWMNTSDIYSGHVFVDNAVFEETFLNENNPKFVVVGLINVRFDYNAVKSTQAEYLRNKLNKVCSDHSNEIVTFTARTPLEVLDQFATNSARINITLIILQIPVLVLICAFLYMISDQMLQMERNEISQLKSRGAGRGQIILLYFLQSVILAGLSLVIAIPLGIFLCRAIGSSNAFLEFVGRRALTIRIDEQVIYYAIAAFFVSVAMTVIPVIRYSKVSIVNLKQSKARSKKPFWQRFYLDFVVLAVSVYGYYSFSRQKDALMEQVASGNGLDPLLFISSSLFILGAGMVVIRFIPLIVKIIYKIGAKLWKPAEYASFLQTIRTGNKQLFIMIFLVLTVALGIFNATVARTILSNAERNISYIDGADIVLKEKWRSNETDVNAGKATELVYYEPDFNRYTSMEQVASAAKVFRVDRAMTNVPSWNSADLSSSVGGSGGYATLMGINTKEFGENTDLEEGLLVHQYREYLNVLSTNADACLVSSVYRDKSGKSIGDTITVSYNDKSATFKIYGFVDYWPGWIPTSTVTASDGTVITVDNPLIVAHFSSVKKYYGNFPYEVWIKLKNPDSSTGFIYDWAEENNITFTKFMDASEDMKAIRNDTMYQGTNGVLTMSFIIILVLCVVGFLIYWILSIRSRELLFGVFRAMGMTRNEIMIMLVNEQLFSSLPAILFGAGLGILASKLFVPLIQIAYASTTQVLPLYVLTETSDVVRLAIVLAVMFGICLFVLARLVYTMKISQALKLGED